MKRFRDIFSLVVLSLMIVASTVIQYHHHDGDGESMCMCFDLATHCIKHHHEGDKSCHDDEKHQETSGCVAHLDNVITVKKDFSITKAISLIADYINAAFTLQPNNEFLKVHPEIIRVELPSAYIGPLGLRGPPCVLS